jgi:hypothetical protein
VSSSAVSSSGTVWKVTLEPPTTLLPELVGSPATALLRSNAPPRHMSVMDV